MKSDLENALTNKDYYHTLGVSSGADAAEIKKAYFALLRKYPPERYPDEFMQIREAYEILIDENTRKQYDEIDTLPDMVKKLVRYGKKALNEGNSHQVVNTLEQLLKVYPRYTVVKKLLGEAYNLNGNTTKAVKIYEALVSEEPQNAGFVGELAHAYLNRGWHKKALDQYRQALKLDPDNISLWLGLIDCHMKARDRQAAKEVILEALETSQKNGWDNLELYYHIIQIDIIMGNKKELEANLSVMKEKARHSDEDRSNVAWFLATLSQHLHKYGYLEQSAITINTAYELLPDDEKILEIKEEINHEAFIEEELNRLAQDPSIDEVFDDIFDFETGKCNCPECQVIQLNMEVHILMHITDLRKDIRRLKEHYPFFYSLKEDFFRDVLNPKKEDNLKDKYAKKMERYQKQYPEYFDNSDLDEEGSDDFLYPTEPIKRETPKIGRNEPCPCGSGKKYKKCCG